MKTSELIAILQALQAEHGDIEVGSVDDCEVYRQVTEAVIKESNNHDGQFSYSSDDAALGAKFVALS